MYIYIFPGGSGGKEFACNAGDLGSIPRLGRFSGGGHGYPLQHYCQENFMDRGAWQAAVGVTKSQTQLSVHIYIKRCIYHIQVGFILGMQR